MISPGDGHKSKYRLNNCRHGHCILQHCNPCVVVVIVQVVFAVIESMSISSEDSSNCGDDSSNSGGGSNSGHKEY